MSQENKFFTTVRQSARAEFEEKKSLFIGHVIRCDTEEEVREALRKAIIKHPGEIVATTYMAREQGSLEEIFGHPRSRDLMQDKKFLKELTL